MLTIHRKLNSQSGASIVIALIFFLLCLTVGAVVLTAATANAGRVTRIQSEQRAYFAVRSAAESMRDGIDGVSYTALYEDWQSGSKPDGYTGNDDPEHYGKIVSKSSSVIDLSGLEKCLENDSYVQFNNEVTSGNQSLPKRKLTVATENKTHEVLAEWGMGKDYAIAFKFDIAPEGTVAKYQNPMTLTIKPSVVRHKGLRTVYWTEYEKGTDADGNSIKIPHSRSANIRYWTVDVTWGIGEITKGGTQSAS